MAVADEIAGKHGHVNYGVIPSVIYTSPEVAAVGLTEQALKEQGRKFKAGKFQFMANARAKANFAAEGFVKLLADAETDRILGCHVIGPSAGGPHPRGLRRHGVRRRRRGPGADLPRPPDLFRGDARGGAGLRPGADPRLNRWHMREGKWADRPAGTHRSRDGVRAGVRPCCDGPAGEVAMSEFWKMPGAEIARLVAAGEASAREVTESALARLAAVNPAINAVVQEIPDEALAEADRVDARRRAGEDPGPLAGVPVTIKVNADQKGHATTNGVRIQKDLVAAEDNPVVANLRRAGAVIVGRTNAPAFSLRWFCRNSLHGATKNPRDASPHPRRLLVAARRRRRRPGSAR